jgi:CO/xanthine dehydrogenase Mo-binding subunit
MNAALPTSLRANPRLSSWITVRAGGGVDLRVGKIEFGQGIYTALEQIAASELGVSAGRVTLMPVSTASSPDEGFTAGSMSVSDSGTAVRQVCAEVRSLFLAAAARRTGLAEDALHVDDGVIRDRSGTPVESYWTLAAQVDLDVDAGGVAARDTGHERAPDLPRVDLPDKVFGRPRFIHDLVLPGMLHARVIRPPAVRAHLVEAPVDLASELPGVACLVRDGDFLAVIAREEEQAHAAAARLAEATVWKSEDSLLDESSLPRWLRSQPSESTIVRAMESEPVHAAGETVLRAAFSRPLLAHASIAVSCGLAQWRSGTLHVWTHSQGIFSLRGAIAQALGAEPSGVVVHHVEGAGCYGHNPADDAAFDAALLAGHAGGRPVRVLWTRADELRWTPFGPAMAAEVSATLTPGGTVSDWTYQVWSNGHTSRPGYEGSPGLLAAAQREGGTPLPPSADPPAEHGYGSARNAVPGYAFDRLSVVAHRVLSMPIRTSALRSLGAYFNVFSIESFMDELARQAGADPLAFRLAHLRDDRARAVLTTAAREAGWDRRREGDGTGQGIAYARYKNRGAHCAAVAEVEAADSVKVRRLVLAVDVGRVVSMDGVRNQIEGGAVQSTSWTTKERVRFGPAAVTSTDWEAYPILRFSEAPSVEVHVIDRPGEPSVGAGEAAQGPVAAAIANALHAAIGVRVRDLPLTPERVVAAMDG